FRPRGRVDGLKARVDATSLLRPRPSARRWSGPRRVFRLASSVRLAHAQTPRAVLAGRDTGEAPEHGAEVARAAESRPAGDARDRRPWLGQEPGGVVDARLQDEAMRRRSRGAVEEPGEVVWAHAGHRAEPGQREGLVQVGP